jgi:indole-3-glycerol phosphate synthase
MSFLERMARASRERVRAARGRVGEARLLARARAQPLPPALTLLGFDIIAELKLRSPAAGALAAPSFDRAAQLDAYARGGAAAVSVLTEPDEFHGELADLTAAAAHLAPLGRPAMRKDFIVDAYQVVEARAAGAGGVLVIVNMLDDETVRELVDCARELGLFVLLEAFDRDDLERLAPFDAPSSPVPLLAGVNCRDLRDLDVRFPRFEQLAPFLPRHLPTVAESGIGSADDLRTVASLGYRLALIGSALMRSAEPGATLARWLELGRAESGGARECS